MEIGNEMQSHKIWTNSELIYEDGSIWLTLISIKIIGSDTLCFPLPPSEVLQRLGPFKVSIVLRPVLLEEAKGIHKCQILHKLRLYYVFFVLYKWR